MRHARRETALGLKARELRLGPLGNRRQGGGQTLPSRGQTAPDQERAHRRRCHAKGQEVRRQTREPELHRAQRFDQREREQVAVAVERIGIRAGPERGNEQERPGQPQRVGRAQQLRILHPRQRNQEQPQRRQDRPQEGPAHRPLPGERRFGGKRGQSLATLADDR